MTESLSPDAANSPLLRVAAAVAFRRAAEEELDDSVIEAHEAGLSDNQIAEVVGVTGQAIHQRRQRILSGGSVRPQSARWVR